MKLKDKLKEIGTLLDKLTGSEDYYKSVKRMKKMDKMWRKGYCHTIYGWRKRK